MLQAPSKVPVLFNPAGVYDAQSLLLISLADTPITLTADQVISMPWRQFVRLMKVRLPELAPVHDLVRCAHASIQRPMTQHDICTCFYLVSALLPDIWLCMALQAYIAAIGQLLPEAEAQPKSDAAQRAEQLGREAMYIGSCLAAGIPRHTRTLYCLKLQEGGPKHSRAPCQLWAAITLQMNLSPAQRQVTQRCQKTSNFLLFIWEQCISLGLMSS